MLSLRCFGDMQKNKIKSVLRWGGEVLELRAEAKLAKTQNYPLERRGEQRQHRTQGEENVGNRVRCFREV